jgi:hypothetical protein
MKSAPLPAKAAGMSRSGPMRVSPLATRRALSNDNAPAAIMTRGRVVAGKFER